MEPYAEPFEEPLTCLSVRFVRGPDGEIAHLELATLMNDIAGRNKWITTGDWRFMLPPFEIEGDMALPVVLPEAAATRAILNDLTEPDPRILFSQTTTSAQTRKWRWWAFVSTPNDQGKGFFPWEEPHA